MRPTGVGSRLRPRRRLVPASARRGPVAAVGRPSGPRERGAAVAPALRLAAGSMCTTRRIAAAEPVGVEDLVELLPVGAPRAEQRSSVPRAGVPRSPRRVAGQHARRVLAFLEADGEGVVAQRAREGRAGGSARVRLRPGASTACAARPAITRPFRAGGRTPRGVQPRAVLLGLEQAAQRLVHRLGIVVQVLARRGPAGRRPSQASRRRPAPCAAPPCVHPPPGARSARRARLAMPGTRARMMRVSRSTSG